MFKKQFSVMTAISLTAFLGSSVLIPTTADAFTSGVANKMEKPATDFELANIYLKNNPSLAKAMASDEADFKKEVAKMPNNSYSDMEKIKNKHKEFDNQRKQNILRFANQARKDREILGLKKDKNYKQIPGRSEPRGDSEARRLALQCGPKENVGYTNYFGEKRFYTNEYPFVAPEIADIEAIPVLRYKLLPNIDGVIRKFISDKQLTFRGQNYNTQRQDLHSGIHERGGQRTYVKSVYDMSTKHHGERSDKLSENMLYDINKALLKIRIDRPTPSSNSFGRDNERMTMKVSGIDILNECRYFWANNNTVRYVDPDEGNGFVSYRVRNQRVGIRPGYILAEPVSVNGTPVAQIDLNKDKLNDSVDEEQVSERMSKYEERLGSKLPDRSAEDVIKKNFGNNNDPYEGKALSDTQNNLYENRTSTYDEYLQNRKSRSSQKKKGLSFEDIYQ